MSWVIAAPEYVAAAANDLAGIGSVLGQANMAALAPISGVLPAGADEVSAAISALFGAHAQAYQALSAQAAMFHQQFVQLMTAGAGEYAAAEAANVLPMQLAAGAINDPAALTVSAPAVKGAAGTPQHVRAGGLSGTGGSVAPAQVSSNGGAVVASGVAPAVASARTASPAALAGSAAAVEPAGPTVTAAPPVSAPLSAVAAPGALSAVQVAASSDGPSVRTESAVSSDTVSAPAGALASLVRPSDEQSMSAVAGPLWPTAPSAAVPTGSNLGPVASSMVSAGLFGPGGTGANGGLTAAGHGGGGGGAANGGLFYGNGAAAIPAEMVRAAEATPAQPCPSAASAARAG